MGYWEDIFRLIIWKIPNRIANFGSFLVKWVVYLALVLGPALFYFKSESHVDFVLRFAIIPFTVGMFSFMIDDKKDFEGFKGIGVLYLASGALSIVAFTSSGFFPLSDTVTLGIVPHYVSYFFMNLTNLLLFAVEYGSIFGFSLFFGLGTLLALERTWSYGEESIEEEVNILIKEIKSKLVIR